MVRRRIGNDISIEWSVYRGDTPENFTGKTVRLYIIERCGKKQEILSTNITIVGNKISFTWKANNQYSIGNYSIILEEYENDELCNTVDIADAIELVANTALEDGDSDYIADSSVTFRSDFNVVFSSINKAYLAAESASEQAEVASEKAQELAQVTASANKAYDTLKELLSQDIQAGGGGGDSFWEEDENGDLVPKPKEDGTARGVYTLSFLSAGGKNANAGGGGGGGGISYFEIVFENDPYTKYALDDGVVTLPAYPTVPDVSGFILKTTADTLYQPKGNYLTSIPSEYITETELSNALSPYLLSQTAAETYATINTLNTHIVDYTEFKTNTNKRLLSLEDMFEWDDDGYIKAKAGLYTDSFISSGGKNTSGGSGGGGGLTSFSVVLNNKTYTSDNGVATITEQLQPLITANNKLDYSLISGTPTSLPASDVYDWAKAATKPTYAFSEITSKPTTLAGYGITDALKTDGSNEMKGRIKMGSYAIQWNVDSNSYILSPEPMWTSGVYDLAWYNGSVWKQIAFTDSNVASATKAKILTASDGTSPIIHDSGATIYVGDSVYPSRSLDLLGKVINLRYGASATYGLVLNNAGNVLIGTSTDDYSGAKLQVTGAINITDNYKIGGLDVLRVRTDHLAIGEETAYYSSLPTKIYGQRIAMQYGKNKTGGFILNESGNVTIGASDLAGTSAKLHIDGNLRIGTESATLSNIPYIYLWKGDGTYKHRGLLSVNEGGVTFDYYNPNVGTYRILCIGPDGLTYGNNTSSNKAFTINSSDNVLIGTTDSANEKLQVYTTTTTEWGGVGAFMSKSLVNTHIQLGRDRSVKNSAFWGYHHVGTTSDNNYQGFGFWSTDYFLRIYANGNVLIGGTTDNSSKLQVSGASGDGLPLLSVNSSTNETWNYMASFLAPNTSVNNGATISLGHSHAVKKSALLTYRITGSSNYLSIHHYGADNILNIYDNGNVGIGTTNPTSKLQVNGNISASGAITAGTASDKRLKNNICTIDPNKAIEVIMALNPITYQWNDKAKELGGFEGISQGFVAQEYESIIPNSGRAIWGEYRAIDYTKVIPYMVSVEQNHETRIQHIVSVAQNHETRLEILERENKELKQEIIRLKEEYYGIQ